MNILAIETSFGRVSVAVKRSSGEVFEPAFDAALQSEHLIPAIRDALALAAAGWGDIDRIAVTLGPGTFTGVRVGIAAARGLSLATGIETVGAGTLEVMAQQVAAMRKDDWPGANSNIAVCVDAKRERAYLQLFDLKGAAIGAACLWDGRESPGAPQATSWIAAGSGASIFAEWARGRGDPVHLATTDLFPTAAALAHMAHRLEPGPIRPVYLRAPDAKPQTGKALALAGADTPP